MSDFLRNLFWLVLAALGGYVLWKALQRASAAVSNVSDKVNTIRDDISDFLNLFRLPGKVAGELTDAFVGDEGMATPKPVTVDGWTIQPDSQFYQIYAPADQAAGQAWAQHLINSAPPSPVASTTNQFWTLTK